MKRFFWRNFRCRIGRGQLEAKQENREGYPCESDEEKKYLFSKYLIKQKFAPCT